MRVVALGVRCHQRLATAESTHAAAHAARFGLLLLLAVLGATVLEPDLHLPLGQLQVLGQLGLPADRDVARVVELLLQLEPLLVGVHHPVLVFRACLPCGKMERVKKERKKKLEHFFKLSTQQEHRGEKEGEKMRRGCVYDFRFLS